MEDKLTKACGSWRISLGAFGGTILIFSALSLSQLNKIEPVAEETADRIEMFVPPPPPPPPAQIETEEKPKQVPMDVDITLDVDKTNMTYRPVDAAFRARIRTDDQMDVNLDNFKKPSVTEGLEDLIYDSADVDEAPSRSYAPSPTFPNKYTKKYKNMRFIVLYAVDEKGRPYNIHVLDTPDIELNKFVVKWIKQWRCRPAKKNGKKVKSWVRHAVRVNFGSGSPFSL